MFCWFVLKIFNPKNIATGADFTHVFIRLKVGFVVFAFVFPLDPVCISFSLLLRLLIAKLPRLVFGNWPMVFI